MTAHVRGSMAPTPEGERLYPGEKWCPVGAHVVSEDDWAHVACEDCTPTCSPWGVGLGVNPCNQDEVWCVRGRHVVALDALYSRGTSDKACHFECKDCHAASKRAKYAEDPEPFKKKALRWRLANPEKVRQIAHRGTSKRRAAKENAYNDGHTRQEAIDSLAQDRDIYGCQLQGDECTGGADALDHVWPINEKRGGGHTIGNLVWACTACNSSKHDMTPAEWQQFLFDRGRVAAPPSGEGVWGLL